MGFPTYCCYFSTCVHFEGNFPLPHLDINRPGNFIILSHSSQKAGSFLFCIASIQCMHRLCKTAGTKAPPLFHICDKSHQWHGICFLPIDYHDHSFVHYSPFCLYLKKYCQDLLSDLFWICLWPPSLQSSAAPLPIWGSWSSWGDFSLQFFALSMFWLFQVEHGISLSLSDKLHSLMPTTKLFLSISSFKTPQATISTRSYCSVIYCSTDLPSFYALPLNCDLSNIVFFQQIKSCSFKKSVLPNIKVEAKFSHDIAVLASLVSCDISGD